VGSYGFNQWLYSNSGNGGQVYNGQYPQFVFMNQGNINHPAMTPVLVDAVWENLVPLENDTPPSNLANPSYSASTSEMGRCCIPRHGYNPSKAPTQLNWVPGSKLPGSINMGLVDGHVELVKLQTLWSYYWHLNWTPATHPYP
jgi:prepilin-type processing-associated H-X9-DG protein